VVSRSTDLRMRCCATLSSFVICFCAAFVNSALGTSAFERNAELGGEFAERDPRS
jgi:hypothetical protein